MLFYCNHKVVRCINKNVTESRYISPDNLFTVCQCCLSLHFSAAYAGDTCSEDRNGCAEIECFRGVECRDIPAPGVGAVCGSCPSGFTGDGMKCSGTLVTACLE